MRTRPFLFTDSGLDAALYAGTPEQVQQWVGVQTHTLLPEQVVPVCSPALLAGRDNLTPLSWRTARCCNRPPGLKPGGNGSTRRAWMPQAVTGPRYELFSMRVAAATRGLGVALMPTLLIGAELKSGALVVACPPAPQQWPPLPYSANPTCPSAPPSPP